MPNSDIDIIDFAEKTEKTLCFKEITGKSLETWMLPFAECVTSEGAIPYLLRSHQRYRASPLASALIWLNDAGMLSEKTKETMKNGLVLLRDNNLIDDVDVPNMQKLDDDDDGWSLGEGVSVWSTSLAIIALIEKNSSNNVAFEDVLCQSAEWLSDQQTGNGWAYQSHKNCEINVPMTALALTALSLTIKYVAKLTMKPKTKIIASLKNGFEFIKSKQNTSFSYVFWKFKEESPATCFSTTWTLYALKEMCDIPELKQEVEDYYNSILNKSTKYILSRIPRKESKWTDEKIVIEAGAKYNKQKNYSSFSPTLILQLLSLGVSPYEPSIINQINWLINNDGYWHIKSYDKEEMCAFTYAMALATIAKWIRFVGIENAKKLIKLKSLSKNKISNFIFGYPWLISSPVLHVSKERIKYILFSMVVIGTITVLAIFIVRPLLMYLIENADTVVVNVIAGIISTTIFGILGLIFKIIKKFKNR